MRWFNLEDKIGMEWCHVPCIDCSYTLDALALGNKGGLIAQNHCAHEQLSRIAVDVCFCAGVEELKWRE